MFCSIGQHLAYIFTAGSASFLNNKYIEFVLNTLWIFVATNKLWKQKNLNHNFNKLCYP